MKKAVVITGVSTGFGFATAEELIRRGYRVFGSVRRQADGDRVQTALGADFTPLIFDVTDEAGIRSAAAQVEDIMGDSGIVALVNNAGIAHSGPLMHSPLADAKAVFDVNVFGLLAVTQAFLPLLGAAHGSQHAPGRIVNLGSVSGAITFPFVGIYAASKHAVEALSDGLRRELKIYGISVSLIQPGAIKTPIWDKGMPAGQPTLFDGTDYAPIAPKLAEIIAQELKHAKPIEVVVNAICHAVEAPRPKSRYPLVGLLRIRRFLSDALLDRVMTAKLGLSSKRAV